MRPAANVLRRGEIVHNAVRYQIMTYLVTGLASIFLIPLLPILLPIVWAYYTRYYASLEVLLTTRELHVRRGVLIRQEKSIPLEKITDLAVYQGPVMRRMGLKGIQLETAGQNPSGMALVKIVGLAETDEFRDAVLDQRDKIADRSAADPVPPDGSAETLLREIQQTLLRIEKALTPPQRTSPE